MENELHALVKKEKENYGLNEQDLNRLNKIRPKVAEL